MQIVFLPQLLEHVTNWYMEDIILSSTAFPCKPIALETGGGGESKFTVPLNPGRGIHNLPITKDERTSILMDSSFFGSA